MVEFTEVIVSFLFSIATGILANTVYDYICKWHKKTKK